MTEPSRSDRIVIDALFSGYTFPNFLAPIQRRAEEFERLHPEYKINVGSHYFQNLAEEISKATLAGRPPTMASYYSGASQLARDTLTADGRPLYTSVEKAIGGRAEILGHPVVLDDIVAAGRHFYTIDGTFAALPVTLSTMHMYTNTTLLRAAGIDEVPRTWQEIERACAAVAALPGGPPHAISWANDGKFFQQALAHQGALLVDQDNGRTGRATKIDLRSPEMMAYVMWWYRLFRDGHYLHTGKLEDWAGSSQAFAEQRVVFRFSSSFESPYMVKAGRENGFEVAVTPTPHNGDVPFAGNWIGGDAMWLADGLDEATRDGALAFMQYLNSPRNAAEWHKVYGSAPVTGAAAALLEREGWYDEHPYHRVATEQLDLTTGAPGAQAAVLGHFAQIQHEMMFALEDMMARGADPAERWERAAVAAEALLEDYGASCTGPGPRAAHCLLIDS
ncbi:sn-glycerol-3-phosphate-binding periplasmic protein UgpB [Sphaerisporangium rufum]|uniref:Sn-glycerol-3-phosphate-binding periplasmic protein UgpB n=1 Tax=Sphaerisporangium rufum TaxID=1381558 RepID=A0A919R337_9ACTN|nr:extracellular solute-binding protein [Sphaerisporangium rufum]GII76220.1 sn-glycerol-3-phosphate-binding periplasmic protein UgpB [Sphaerisporangium rufum]